MRQISILLFAVIAFCGAPALAAETYVTQSLAYESAAKMLNGSLKEAAKQERNVAIVVIDARGDIIASARMDGAKPVAFALAVNKAKTALLFRGSSRTAMEEINKGSTALLSLGDLAALPGGLAVQHSGEFLGAIGVSGAPADIDEQIAAAGLAKIED